MKSDEINKYYFDDVNTPLPKYDRREFLKKLGGGVIIVFSLSQLGFVAGCKNADEDQPDFNAYLRVKEDGSVDCYSGKIEMGQGINTSLAQVLADELEVSLDKVNMIMGETDLVPYDAGTWGSLTHRFHDPLIRAAAAEARMVLIELASEKLDIPADQLEASEGKIFSKEDNTKSVAYEELTQGKKIVRSLSKKPDLKKPGEFDVIGKPLLRRDAYEKVTGKALYSADIQPEGVLYARILRPPAHDAKLVSVDTSKAESIEGVMVLREEDFIVALHKDQETADLAVYEMEAEWETPSSDVNGETVFKHILKTATESNERRSGGSLEKGKNESDLLFDEEYHDGYKAHASIEPHAATAIFENGEITMWASSQTPFGTRREVSELLGLPVEKVHIKQIYLGGGFGGKIYNQQAIEAARIAKMVEDTPVQLMWNRQEEFMYDRFRSAAVVKINSGMKEDGKITFLDFNAYCSGARGTDMFYAIENHKTTTWDGDDVHFFYTGAWRAPGNPTNTFAREVHLDIMAHKIGMDTFEFRMKNMGDKRAQRSLELAAKKFGWNNWERKPGYGRGIAVGFDAGTFVTIIAEVHVDTDTGKVKVTRAVVGQDMGQVVNPEGAEIQAEGCVNMGLGYSLTEDIDFEGGEVKNKNFNDYQLPIFSMIPEEIEVINADVMDEPPQGGGEPAIVSVGGAIANAVFDACGARVHRMPLTPERVLDALKKS
ncbi:MAG: molybdopterin cofactor-binding domain-containing protein [Bacteroidales bacterium]